MTTHDIYIYPTDKGKAGGIQIPWLPNSIEFDSGGMRAAKYEILNLGEVNIPTGSNLGAISFASIFPGEGRKNLPFMKGSYKSPSTYDNLMRSWVKSGKRLKVIVTGTPINHYVYLENYTSSYSGAYGDISYNASLKTRRDISIQTISKPKKSPKKNKPKPKPKKSTKTYTVKRGDNLWTIASRYLGRGSRNKEIYKLNKSIIEKTAKKHGRRSSNGGWWIYPGTKLKLPAR